jgi:hypothetical protein
MLGEEKILLQCDRDVHENMTAYARIERRSAPPLPLKKPTPVCHAARSLFLCLASQLGTLCLLALHPPFPRSLCLRTLCVHLVLDLLVAGLLGLCLVNLTYC